MLLISRRVNVRPKAATGNDTLCGGLYLDNPARRAAAPATDGLGADSDGFTERRWSSGSFDGVL